jgi:hypothetical protein
MIRSPDSQTYGYLYTTWSFLDEYSKRVEVRKVGIEPSNLAITHEVVINWFNSSWRFEYVLWNCNSIGLNCHQLLVEYIYFWPRMCRAKIKIRTLHILTMQTIKNVSHIADRWRSQTPMNNNLRYFENRIVRREKETYI